MFVLVCVCVLRFQIILLFIHSFNIHSLGREDSFFLSFRLFWLCNSVYFVSFVFTFISWLFFFNINIMVFTLIYRYKSPIHKIGYHNNMLMMIIMTEEWKKKTRSENFFFIIWSNIYIESRFTQTKATKLLSLLLLLRC